MKKLTIILASLALVLGMAQCKKVNQQEEQNIPDNGESIYATLTATNGGSAKTEIFPSGLVQWTSGDKLYVVGSTDGYLGTLTTVNYYAASNTAEFGGNITIPTATTQTLHFYYFGKTNVSLSGTTYTYNIASQDGTLDSIENTMHLMHGSVANITAGTTQFGNVIMNNMMAIAKFDICGYASPAKCSNAIISRTLNLSTGEWSDNGTLGNITLTNPTTAYYMALIPSTTSQTLTFSNNDDTHQVTKSKEIVAGNLYTDNGNSIMVRPATFTVSNTPSTVIFSPGNLQYIGSATTPYWKFADYQWEYFGNANAYDSTHTNINRDLFGWGCTGYSDTRSQYQKFFQPYSTNNSDAYTSGTTGYTRNIYGYGPDYVSSSPYSLTVNNHSDWGCLSITNPNTGTVDSGTWRTLTKDEWAYLFNTRTVNGGTGEGHSYQRTTLTLSNGTTVYGLLLLPDYFIGSVSATTSWSDWQSLEASGVVFLPASGNRTGSSVDTVGSNGGYWSSTPGSSSSGAYSLSFSSSSVEPQHGNVRYRGRAVRLVKDIN